MLCGMLVLCTKLDELLHATLLQVIQTSLRFWHLVQHLLVFTNPSKAGFRAYLLFCKLV